MSALPRDDDRLLADVEELLRLRIGLDVTTVGRSLVRRAVERRMESRATRDLAGYVSRLADDAMELAELVEAVVIPETYFFREPEALQAVVARVVAGPLPSAEAPLRILSAPCSTGEEPYSIAALLLAAGVPADALRIDALDLSREAVRRARAATYRSGSFRGDVVDWRPFFTERGAERVLRDEVRRVVRIEQANLLAPDFRAPGTSYDVVFCRNLLIYFDADAQARVIETLRGLLTPEGVLVVGAADTFAVRRAGFTAVPGTERAFLFQYRPAMPKVELERAGAVPPRVRPARVATARPAPAHPASRPAPPRRTVEVMRDTPPARPVAESALDVMSRLANAGQLAGAARAGEEAVAAGAAGADLLGLLGTTHEALGDETRAEWCYRRALYLEPGHVEALLHLALVLERRGDGDGAARLRLRARRGIAESGGPR